MRATWYYTITEEEHRDNQPGREEEASLPPPLHSRRLGSTRGGRKASLLLLLSHPRVFPLSLHFPSELCSLVSFPSLVSTHPSCLFFLLLPPQRRRRRRLPPAREGGNVGGFFSFFLHIFFNPCPFLGNPSLPHSSKKARLRRRGPLRRHRGGPEAVSCCSIVASQEALVHRQERKRMK